MLRTQNNLLPNLLRDRLKVCLLLQFWKKNSKSTLMIFCPIITLLRFKMSSKVNYFSSQTSAKPKILEASQLAFHWLERRCALSSSNQSHPALRRFLRCAFQTGTALFSFVRKRKLKGLSRPLILDVKT